MNRYLGIPVSFSLVQNTADQVIPCKINQDIDFAIALDSRVNDTLPAGHSSHAITIGYRGTPRLLDLRHSLLGYIKFVVINDNLGTFLSHQYRYRLADAAHSAAGYDCYLAVQFASHRFLLLVP